jgi:hypothetical protein
VFRRRGLDPRQGGEERPLVRERLELLVNEDGIAMASWFLLKRQRDEIAEPTPRHSVLVREETVIGPHAQFVPASHGFRET